MTRLPSHPEPMICRAFARAYPALLDVLDPFTEALLYGDAPFCLGEPELIPAHAVHTRPHRRGAS